MKEMGDAVGSGVIPSIKKPVPQNWRSHWQVCVGGCGPLLRSTCNAAPKM